MVKSQAVEACLSGMSGKIRCSTVMHLESWNEVYNVTVTCNLVAGLLGLHARLAVAHTSLLEAAALHLDVADEHSPSAIQAWAVLAQTLSTAARALLNLQVSCLMLMYPYILCVLHVPVTYLFVKSCTDKLYALCALMSLRHVNNAGSDVAYDFKFMAP